MGADEEAAFAAALADSDDVAPAAEKELPVTVALMMRPLVGPELVDGCQACVFPNATEPSVTLVSDHKFTYDHVYHPGTECDGPTEKKLFEQCVEPLVNGLLSGYNATVLAYGQTGSGKTHTMGTAFEPGGATEGVIPRVMNTLFADIAALTNDVTVNMKVSFIEIHKEGIRDLLGNNQNVSIRDAPGAAGGVALVGVKELPVQTLEKMAGALASGSQSRATAATGMNHRSSRSHAIFTIHVERKGADPADVTRAKMHLVDLAGSERAKRTKAEGQRLKEGIQINKGLLALGNVISALGDDKRRMAGGHVPYRDSKLTRLLQDSLGGNSRTVMVACISPADANLDETLNTLKYANRARNIMNKPTVTFDENASQQVAKLRRMLATARAEVAHLKLNGVSGFSSDSGTSSSVDTTKLEAMEARAMIAEAEAARLRADLVAAEETAAAAQAAELAATVERDRLALKIEDSGMDPEQDEGGSNVIRSYLSTIALLRSEQSRMRHQIKAFQEGRTDPYGEDPAANYDLDDNALEFEEDHEAIDDEEEPLEIDEDLENDELHAELATVERTLQAKEARMRAMSSAAQKLQDEVDAATMARGDSAPTPGSPEQQEVEELREKYGRLLKSLESEKSELAAERDELLAALAAAAKQGDNVRKEVEAKNRARLQELEKRLKEVQKLAAKHKEAQRLREKSDQAAKTLQADIQRLRAARVELVRRMEHAAKEGISKQREAERALEAARKEGRRHAIAAQKAQAAVDRQAAVLRRKTEEAANARDQLRALQAAAKANLRKKPGSTAAIPVVAAVAPAAEVAPTPGAGKEGGPGTGLGLNARKAWLESEISAAIERSELRHALDESLARRAALGRRFPHLASPGKAAFERTPGHALTPGGSVDEAVEEEMRAVTEQIAMLQERVYQSEEREEVRGGMKRWSRVRSLGEARSLLTIMFNSTTNARRKADPGSLPSGASGASGVVEEADAVLRQLKSAKKKPKKFVRPPWQAVGPSSLSGTPEEAQEKKPEPKKKTSTIEYAETSESESDDEMDLAEHDDPEWNEDCQTPAVIGGRVRRVPNKDAVKKGASCTACTQMFSKRVEGHQKSHKRCPFYSMYLLDKDIKSLEVQDGIEAKDELQAKTAELSTETERLRKAVLDGVIQPPMDDAGFSPEVDADSVRDSFSSDDTHEKTNASSGSEGDTPAGARLDVPLSELITTCREARRRAEGLLHASGGTAATNVSRSPFGDVSNSGPGSASATVDVRKRMSFGGVTVGRGSTGGVEETETGGVEETETGGVEETEEFQFKPMVNATEEFQFKPVVNATEEFQFQSSVNPDDL
jgi:kinesin family protein 4/21/27